MFGKTDSMLCGHIRSGMLRLFILASLAGSEKHGYELLKLVRSKMKSHKHLAHSNEKLGRVIFERQHLPKVEYSVSTGELYSLLQAMEKEGCVTSRWTADSRPRKMYKLTGKGRKIIKRTKEYLKYVINELKTHLPEMFGDL